MNSRGGALGVAAVAALLAACGTDSQTSQTSTSTERGTLVQNPPPRLASLTAAALTAELNADGASGQALLQLAGTPTCGVDFYYITYWTVGGANEPASATGALMVPTGGAACTGPRPVVLYAHGTTTDRNYNIADISDTTNSANGESALIAAQFAAQGFIVVAPNYVGYDQSSLQYHPYVNAVQNAADMTDALTAARAALPNTLSAATSDSGVLFITGYSEGGYVAMATHKALQAAGVAVTASAPMSGPYALTAFADYIFSGRVDLGSTEFAPLIVRSYQTAYQNVYTSPSDVFESSFTNAATLLPSTTPIATLFSTGQLPETELFSSTPPDASLASLTPPTTPAAQAPLFALGFGTDNLITNTFRGAYLADSAATPDGYLEVLQGASVAPTPPASSQFGLRQGFITNDLRSWVPTSPVLLCGGENDPTVFFPINTGGINAYWSTFNLPAGLVTTVDMDPATLSSSDPFEELEESFQQTIAGIGTAAGTGTAAQLAELQAYHTTLAPFCTTAARDFFVKLLESAEAAQ